MSVGFINGAIVTRNTNTAAAMRQIYRMIILHPYQTVFLQQSVTATVGTIPHRSVTDSARVTGDYKVSLPPEFRRLQIARTRHSSISCTVVQSCPYLHRLHRPLSTPMELGVEQFGDLA